MDSRAPEAAGIVLALWFIWIAVFAAVFSIGCLAALFGVPAGSTSAAEWQAGAAGAWSSWGWIVLAAGLAACVPIAARIENP